MAEPTKKNTLIRVRPVTREKLDAIARTDRRKLVDVIDLLADERLSRDSRRRRQPA